MMMPLESILADIDKLKSVLDSYYPIPNDRLQKINYKFRLEWNYHSNKMEGGTLTFEETRSVMMAQLEIHGKPLRDVLEMRGHDEVIKNIQKVGRGDIRLTENRIKDIHKAIIFEADDLPGLFKNRNNYIYNYAGERFDFTPKEETAAALNTLTNWLDNELKALNKKQKKSKRTIPDIAFEYHLRFLTIHPFLDGNGRTGRILMNLILISYGYPPIIIRTEEKDVYSKLIAHAQQYEENPIPFYALLGKLLIRSLETCIKGAAGDNIFEMEDWEKRLQLLEHQNTMEQNILKSEKGISSAFDNTFLPLLNYAELKLSAFDKLYAQKSTLKTISMGDDPVTYTTLDVPEIIKQLKDEHKLGALQAILVCFEWSDFKKSSKIDSIYVNLGINLMETGFSIRKSTFLKATVIEKKYNESMSYEEIQLFINELGSQLTDTIENQLFTN
jgi:Fic family protein